MAPLNIALCPPGAPMLGFGGAAIALVFSCIALMSSRRTSAAAASVALSGTIGTGVVAGVAARASSFGVVMCWLCE